MSKTNITPCSEPRATSDGELPARAGDAEPVAWVERADLTDLQNCNGRSLWAESPGIWTKHDPTPPSNLVPLCLCKNEESSRVKSSERQLTFAAPLQAEPHPDTKDALRYRWLRAQVYVDPALKILRIANTYLPTGNVRDALDASVDAARAAIGQAQGERHDG